MNDLLSLGVDGLRLDAAKRKILYMFRESSLICCTTDIAAEDIKDILGRLDGSPYITQEVIYGGAVGPDAYAELGKSPSQC